MRKLVARVRLGWSLLFVAVALTMVPGSACAAEDELIVLPPFEVRGMRPWLYAEFAGFQVLSLANERDTRTIVARWQRAVRFTPLFFPASMPTDFAAQHTLFLHHFAGDRTVSDAARELRVPIRASAQTVLAGDKYIKLPTEQLGNDWRRGAINPLGSHMVGVCDLVAPRAPVWYREALLRLLMTAEMSDTWLEVRLGRLRPSEMVPLAQLFAVATSEQYVTLLNRSRRDSIRWLATAQAFAHWGLFANDGAHRNAFLEFLAEAAGRGTDDAMFSRHFGMNLAAGNAAISAHADSGQRSRIDLPPAVAATPLPPVFVRSALESEVAWISGEFYLALGQSVFRDDLTAYAAKAEGILRSAHAAGFRDPRLLMQMGFLELYLRRPDVAQLHFELACASPTAGPRAWAALALLRFGSLPATTSPPAATEAGDLAEITRLLAHAQSLHPQVPEAWALAVELALRQDPPPGESDWTALAAGARLFPREIDLILKLAILRARTGHHDDAVRLTTEAASWPGHDATDRARLLDFAAQIRAAPAP